MAKIRIDFERCDLGMQKMGTGEYEEMTSRMSFFINVNGRRVNDLYHTYIKQTVGGNYAEVPIEVGPPCDNKERRYEGPPWNYQAYRDEVEAAYRRLVGPEGSAFAGRGVKMGMSTMLMKYSVTFEAEDAM
jgi:hypothetical protein